MKKQDEETKGKESDEVLKAKFGRWWSAAYENRHHTDWKWFIYDLWVSGYHYAKYDKSNQQIITSAKTDGRPKVVINKIYTTLRAVRNYALRNRPRAEVTPHIDLSGEMEMGDVVRQNKFLDFFHDQAKLRRKQKGIVWDGLKYSVGYWQVLFDESAPMYAQGDGKGEIVVNEIDPYDLYWDPNATSKENAKYVFLCVRRNLEDLKHDKKYDSKKLELVKPDKKLSSSTFKERLLQLESGNTPSEDAPKTVLVKECWYWKWVGDERKVFIGTMIGDQVCRNEETDLDRLPFFIFSADVNPRSMLGQGWVKNLISPNKELNRVMSNTAEWNTVFNKGKWISDKGASVRVINNDNGQIIEKKRGYEVKQAVISPMSPIAFNLKDACDTYIEDIGGFHEASMGRIPPGARSGDAIESLQQGDANNMSEIVENLEEFLEEVYEYVLYLAAKKYQFVRTITPMDSLGQREYIKIIGEEASNKPEDAVVIPKSAIVDVKISSWLAQTPDARQQKAKELFQLGLLDEQTTLEFFNVGNIADVLMRVQQRREREQAEEMAMKEQEAAMNKEEVAVSGKEQAIAAIRSLVQGEQPVIPTVVTREYIDYIDQLLQTQEMSPQEREAIQAFRDQVSQMAGRQMA